MNNGVDEPALRAMIREIVREEIEAVEDNKTLCAYCEGAFPERALNYRNGDPACTRCWDALPESQRKSMADR